MGLTIHYGIRSKQRSGSTQKQLLTGLHKLALELHNDGLLAEVDDVKHYDTQALEAINANPDHPDRWLYITANAYLDISQSPIISLCIPPLEVYSLSIWPGPGCADANFGLARYPRTVERDGKTYPTKLPGWRWKSHIKTTYADHPLTAHLALIALLDWLDQQPDLSLTVNDEGEYWQNRDVVALAREFCSDAQYLAGIADAIANLNPNHTIQAPIMERADYPELLQAEKSRLTTNHGDFTALQALIKPLANL